MLRTLFQENKSIAETCIVSEVSFVIAMPPSERSYKRYGPFPFMP